MGVEFLDIFLVSIWVVGNDEVGLQKYVEGQVQFIVSVLLRVCKYYCQLDKDFVLC